MGQALRRFRAVHIPKFPIKLHAYKTIQKKGQVENPDIDVVDLNVVHYRPICLEKLSKRTNFTRRELQTMYRGFKQECPTGIVTEDSFKDIYAQFFPRGGRDSTMYAHYVFNALDKNNSGTLTFEVNRHYIQQFVEGLSGLSRGTIDHKLHWAFNLYDVNHDGFINRQEMTDIVQAIYSLLGRHADPPIDEHTIRDHVDTIFTKMDLNQDGVITMDEFLLACKSDPNVVNAMSYFDTIM